MNNTDIIILVADKNMEGCIDGLLQRLPTVLGIAPFSYEIFVHSYRDPGCRLDADSFLRGFQNRYKYALVVFDREGCGREDLSRTDIEAELEKRLSISGWNDRAKVVVIDPELENWVWVKSPRLAQIINWNNIDDLHEWLLEKGFSFNDKHKPLRPKEAFEMALRESKKRRSSSIYNDIAFRMVGVKGSVEYYSGLKLNNVDEKREFHANKQKNSSEYIIDTCANKRDSSFWNKVRLQPIGSNFLEQISDTMNLRNRRPDLSKFIIAKLLLGGYLIGNDTSKISLKYHY